MMLSCLSVLLLSLSFAVSDACRPDWQLFEESCYGFGEEVLSWAEAQQMCQAARAKLAEVETAEESEFLKNQAKQNGGQYYWIGGTDIFHEGTWVWITTGNVFYPFEDWYPGQPDNSQGHEDCVHMSEPDNYQWNDNACDAELQFVCKAPAAETVVG